MKRKAMKGCYAIAFTCKGTVVPGWHYCPEHLNTATLGLDYVAKIAEIKRLRKALRDVITEVQDDEDRGLALFRCNAVAVKALAPRRGRK